MASCGTFIRVLLGMAVLVMVHGSSDPCPDSLILGGKITSCRVTFQDFNKPHETYSMTIVPKSGIRVHLYLRSSVGAVSMFVSPPGPGIIDTSGFLVNTTIGPRVVSLGADILSKGIEIAGPDEVWSVNVTNIATVTTWWLQVDTFNSSILLSQAQKAVMKDMHDECCTQFKDVTQSAEVNMSTPACQLLQQWGQPVTNATTDACQSKYVQCNEDGTQVLKLMLPGYARDTSVKQQHYMMVQSFNDICTNQFPATLTSFVNLTSLSLEGIGLNWGVEAFGVLSNIMSKMEEVYLGDNRIQFELIDTSFCLLFTSGHISTVSFRSTPNIYEDFTNGLQGPLPGCVFSETLEYLNLDGNAITALPETIGYKNVLRSLRLVNQGMIDPNDPTSQRIIRTLSGSIPKAFAQLQELEYLSLQSNNLSGSIPPLPTSLQFLNLGDNKLTSAPSLSNFTLLKYLNLGDNRNMAADITQMGLSSLTNLSVAVLSNASITGNFGSVPGLKAMTSLEVLELAQTQVTGSIPPALATLPSLKGLVLNDNPGINSMANFAAALTDANMINVFMVNNCSITDLPAGLEHLAVFSKSFGYEGDLNELMSPAVAKQVFMKTYHKVFNISSNQIQGDRVQVKVPDWMVSNFTGAITFSNNNGFLGLQYKRKDGGGNSKENHLICPTVAVSPQELSAVMEVFRPERLYASALYCVDTSGNEIPIFQQLQAAAAAMSEGRYAPPTPTTSRASSSSEKLARASIIGILVATIVVGLLVIAAVVFGVRYLLRARRSRGKFTAYQDEEAHGKQVAMQEPYPKMNEFEVNVADSGAYKDANKAGELDHNLLKKQGADSDVVDTA